VHNPTAKSAFDMALYDPGQTCDLPLYALLGGEKRSLTSDETIGLDEPETMAAKALSLAERGFSISKSSWAQVCEDVRRIQAIRQAVADNIGLRIDANQGWDLKTASRTLNDWPISTSSFANSRWPIGRRKLVPAA